jgi:hypothetical protein
VRKTCVVRLGLATDAALPVARPPARDVRPRPDLAVIRRCPEQSGTTAV